MSYGPNYTERFARAADYVDKILAEFFDEDRTTRR
jgi:hypothetical protein